MKNNSVMALSSYHILAVSRETELSTHGPSLLIMHPILPLFSLYFLITQVSALGPRGPFVNPQLQSSPLWTALNASVEGRLFVAEPFARSCFQRVGLDVGGTFNQSICNEVELKYTDRGT